MFSATFFEGSTSECKEFSPDLKQEENEGIVQLKGNRIPKGFVSLERLFDHHDALR